MWGILTMFKISFWTILSLRMKYGFIMLNLKQKFSQSSGNGIVPRLPRSLSCVHLLAMLYNTVCFLRFTWNNTVSFLTKRFVRDCLILFRIVQKNVFLLHNNAPLSYDLIYSRIDQNMQVTIVVQPAVRPIPCPLVISFFPELKKKGSLETNMRPGWL